MTCAGPDGRGKGTAKDEGTRTRASTTPLSIFENLPDDVLSHVLSQLELRELLDLEPVSKAVQARVNALGLPSYLLAHPHHHITLHPPARTWFPRALIARNHLAARCIAQRDWYALQIGQTWAQPVIPVLHLAPHALVLGVGGKLVVHPLAPRHMLGPRSERREVGGPEERRGYERGGRVIMPAREYPVARRDAGSGADIVGVRGLPDGQMVVAQYDGTAQRLSVPCYTPINGGSATADCDGHGKVDGYGRAQAEADADVDNVHAPDSCVRQLRSTAHFPHPKGCNIHTLTSSDWSFVTTTSSGLVSLYNARSPWSPPTAFSLPPNTRAWSSLLTPPSHVQHPDTIFLGTGSGISLYPTARLPSSPSSSPTTPHRPSRTLHGPRPPASSSAYDLHFPPPSSAHHPSLLLSAWFDSHLRLHDLRAPSPSPIAEFADPYTWADGSAMYSATFLGEHHLAGGGARHGAVSIFDVRMPTRGWSCFSPGGKGSPVYALQGEGGRVWGVTEKRAFVFAFDHDDGHGHEGGNGSYGVNVRQPKSESGATPGEGVGEAGMSTSIAGGVVSDAARARPPKVEERVSGWKGRGGKWGWTVRYPQAQEQARRGRGRGQGAAAGAGAGNGADANATANDSPTSTAAPGPGPERGQGRTRAAGTGTGTGTGDGDEGEGAVGYEHADRRVALFDSRRAPWPS